MRKVVVMADTIMHEGNRKLLRNLIWGVYGGGGGQSDLSTPASASTAMPTQTEKFAVVMKKEGNQGTLYDMWQLFCFVAV